MDPGTLRLVTFSFILSIVFPTFAYTFTTFGDQPDNFDITLSSDQLINAGIKLSEAVSHNVTFGSVAQEYTVKNITMRVQWIDDIIRPDYMAMQQQSWIEKQLGTWIYPIEMKIILDPALGFLLGHHFRNETIINNFDSEYNWTIFEVVENGLTGFVTTLQSDDNNITKAIQETGTVTVTIASKIFKGSDVSAENFANWYIQVVTGQGGDWGLPESMTWIVRVFQFMTLLSGMLLAKEFIPFLN